MSFTRGLALVVAVWAAAATAGEPDESAATATEPEGRREVADAWDKLGKVVPEVRLDGVTLEQAFDALRDLTRANIVVNWRQLEEAGVRRDAVVRLRLWDLPLSKVLDVLLSAVAEGEVELGFRAELGVITVSTERGFAGEASYPLRVYDVRDLIDTAYAYAMRRARVDDEPTVQDVEIEFVELIQRRVNYQSWGFETGEPWMACWAGRLLVEQTPEWHHEIERALAQLREEVRARPEPSPARLWPRRQEADAEEVEEPTAGD